MAWAPSMSTGTPWRDGAQHVAHVGERHKAGRVGKQVLVGVEVALAAVAHRHHAQAHTLAAPYELPGHDVAVVLHGRDDNLVAVVEHVAKGRRHQVDSLGRAAGEDHLLRGAGIDVVAHLLACGLDTVGSLLGDGVHAAVHVGLVHVVHVFDGLHHTARSLRGGSVVEIYQVVPVDLAGEYRVLGPDLVDV